MNKVSLLPVILLLSAALLPSDGFGQPLPRNTNQSRKLRSVIPGGYQNLITSNSRAGVIAGGAGNTIDNAWYSFIGGGDSHRVSGENCTVGGGTLNIAGPARWATVSGGSYNNATGEHATVPGGTRNSAAHAGSFVWSGVDLVDTVSTNTNSFTVRAPGGVRFITSLVDSATVPTGSGGAFTNGVFLAPGSGTWTSLSDRNAKENFGDVNTSDVLAKVAAMPIKTWNYKTQADGIRHIGPTAQDFKKAFGVGESDTGITTVDADGVALAAIQGLVEELKERDKKHAEDLVERDETIEELKSKLQAVEERLDSLPPAP